ncbi:MAG: PilZ domain-containing protein [Candidatus Omnitrophica bacterium]|nr:PilZ domain-containing protein [Candidatus Omnitrophota bacterium]
MQPRFASVDERRLFQRFIARFPAKFKDSRSDFGEEVVLRDASAQGARLSTTETLFLDDHVIVEVELPDGKPSLVLRGRVVWKHSLNEKNWDVGMQFPEPQLTRLSRLFEVTHPSPHDLPAN